MATPQYILDIRAAYGHGLLLLPAVCAVVVHDDRVLLVRRADNGAWSLPAGIMEPGEQPAEAVVREVAEETRVQIRADRLVLLATDEPVTYANGDTCQFVAATFAASYLGGEAGVGDDESSEVGWFAADALPELSDRDRRRLAAARAG